MTPHRHIDNEINRAAKPVVLNLRDIRELIHDGFEDRVLPQQQSFR